MKRPLTLMIGPLNNHKRLMQSIYSVGQMARVVRADGHNDFLNLGFEKYRGQRASSRTKQVQMVEEVLSVVDPREGETIIDFGCGVGGALRLLLETYSVDKVIGLNIDEKQISRATVILKRWVEQGGCKLVECDLEKALLPEWSADKIYSIEVLTHITNKFLFFLNARRILKPGGRFVVAFTALAKNWDSYSAEDQEYMSNVGRYFNEEPRDFLTQPACNKIAEDAGFVKERIERIGDNVFQHRHERMVAVLKSLQSRNILKRMTSQFYWKFREGCETNYLKEYLSDVVCKNQANLYEYYICAWRNQWQNRT